MFKLLVLEFSSYITFSKGKQK